MARFFPLFAAAFVAVSAPAAASADVDFSEAVSSAQELPPYLQCVPYAREVSGIQIFGDAYTWWEQAEGRYKRGNKPKVGAVMALRPYGNMTLGHVAAVSKVLDKRTVLLRHANWSPIDGRRGQIENDVRAVDVSPDNDWSEVRVWYAPLQELGTTAWPVEGFIYNDRDRSDRVLTVASETPRAAPAPAKPKVREDIVANIIAANS